MQLIPVVFRTNLDLDDESWPKTVVSVPRVGDRVCSTVVHKGGFVLELEVSSITWKEFEPIGYPKSTYPFIELHMTSWQKNMPSKTGDAAPGSITAFYQWYAPKVGRSVGAFI